VDAGTRGAATVALVSAGGEPWATSADDARTWRPDRTATDVLRRARGRYRRWTAALAELYDADHPQDEQSTTTERDR
ncbi:MAG: hypothetical protein ACRYG2_08730, partial [Janthinobacterium lividum]